MNTNEQLIAAAQINKITAGLMDVMDVMYWKLLKWCPLNLTRVPKHWKIISSAEKNNHFE